MSSGSEYKCCECQELHPQQAFIPHAGNDVEIAKEAARACCLAQVAPYLFEYSAEFSQPAIDNARTIANEINNSDIFLVVLSPSVSKAFWTQAWIGFEIGVSIGADIASNKVLYPLQHLLKCGECGHNFHAKAQWRNTSVRNGKKYQYDLTTPRRYYMCNGTHSLRLRCRERPSIRAERLEEPIWNEVKRVLQNPDLIVAGIDSLDSQESGGLEAEIAQAKRDLRSIQMEEDRAIRLFVSGKITEAQLDHQRRFITERLESARARLDDYRAREAGGAEKRRLMEAVLAWAREVGKGLDELTDEQRKELLQMVVDQVAIDRNNNVDITLAIPIDGNYPGPDAPEPDSSEPGYVAIASDKSYLNATKLEDFIIGKVRERILTEETITELVTLVAEEIDVVAGEIDGKLKAIGAEIADVEGRLENLYQALETKQLPILRCCRPASWH